MAGCMGQCRGSLAAHDRRGLVDKFVILESSYHKQGKVYTAREVALQNGITYVPAPYRQALAISFLEVAPADDGPFCIAGKYPPACFHLVVEIREANQPREPPEDPYNRFELPCVPVFTVQGDMPAA